MFYLGKWKGTSRANRPSMPLSQREAKAYPFVAFLAGGGQGWAYAVSDKDEFRQWFREVWLACADWPHKRPPTLSFGTPDVVSHLRLDRERVVW